jgi:uncharacterized membrane protein
MMSEQNNNATQASSEQTNQEQVPAKIHEFLKRLPSEYLISVLAEHNPISDVKTVSQHFLGPLPPPKLLKDYDKVQPGFAERILGMAEKEQLHRQGVEKKALSSDITIQRTGQIFALLLSLVMMGGSMFLIYSNHDAAGVSLASATLLGLAYTFITGHKAQLSHERK